MPKVFDLISFFLPKCRTENLWKWTSLSMVHLNDWRRPQARFPPHRHNLMLTSPTSLRIAAAKAIVVKRYLPTSSLCSTILNKSNFTVLADRVQINRKQDWIRSDLQTKNELNLINLHNTYRESIVSLVSQHYSKLKYAPEKLLLLIQFIYYEAHI